MTIDEIHIGDTILTCHGYPGCVTFGFVRPLTVDGFKTEITRDGSRVTEISVHSEYGTERYREEDFFELFLTPEAAEEYVRERAANANASIEERLNRSLEEIELMHQSILDRDAEID